METEPGGISAVVGAWKAAGNDLQGGRMVDERVYREEECYLNWIGQATSMASMMNWVVNGFWF